MSRAQVLYLHVTLALTTLTGVAFFVMKYLMTAEDEFAVVNHPLQPHALSAHVVIAPLLLFGLGWVFGDHIWPKWRGPAGAPNRGSGSWSMAMIAPMTLSAYLLQISTDETIRNVMAWIHGITSALFVAAYVAHLVFKPKAKPAFRPED